MGPELFVELRARVKARELWLQEVTGPAADRVAAVLLVRGLPKVLQDGVRARRLAQEAVEGGLQGLHGVPQPLKFQESLFSKDPPSLNQGKPCLPGKRGGLYRSHEVYG